jgi:hypothetical protein
MKQTKNQKPKSYISKFLLLFVLAITLSNCQVEEDVVREEDQINAIYKDETVRYLEELKLNATKKQLNKIE